MSDISDIQIKFEVGHPFLPFEQLLAVLPPASKSLLPKTYQVSVCVCVCVCVNVYLSVGVGGCHDGVFDE